MMRALQGHFFPIAGTVNSQACSSGVGRLSSVEGQVLQCLQLLSGFNKSHTRPWSHDAVAARILARFLYPFESCSGTLVAYYSRQIQVDGTSKTVWPVRELFCVYFCNRGLFCLRPSELQLWQRPAQRCHRGATGSSSLHRFRQVRVAGKLQFPADTSAPDPRFSMNFE
jgi:hypothetical protein